MTEAYCTVHQCIPIWNDIIDTVFDTRMSTGDGKTLQNSLWEALSVRFKEIYARKEFCFGYLLDPRHMSLLQQLPRECRAKVEESKLKLKEEYCLLEARWKTLNPLSQGTVQEQPTKKFKDPYGKQVAREPTQLNDIIGSEWDRYFLFCQKFCQDYPNDVENLDVLEWWRKNQDFPIMRQLARSHLVMPAASTTSERSFSLCGQIYTKRRNRLAPERAGKLIFLKMNGKFIK